MRITLLGFGPDVASLMLETLLRLHGEVAVTIIENLPRSDTHVFMPKSGVVVRFVPLDEIDARPEGPFILAMAKPAAKRIVWGLFSERFGLKASEAVSIVSPHTVIASTARVGHGCYIEPAVTLSPYVELQNHVTVNRACSIGHHVILEDFVTVNPGCHLAGHVHVGEGTTIGMGTVVFDHVRIGRDCVIGGGSVVSANVPDGSLASGNPCRVVRQAT